MSQVPKRDGGNNGQESRKISIDTGTILCHSKAKGDKMDRLRGKRKEKRDSWVRQMAEDMPQITQTEIAQRFGLEQSTVSRILKVKPTVFKQIGGEDFPIYQGKGEEKG